MARYYVFIQAKFCMIDKFLGILSNNVPLSIQQYNHSMGELNAILGF